MRVGLALVCGLGIAVMPTLAEEATPPASPPQTAPAHTAEAPGTAPLTLGVGYHNSDVVGNEKRYEQYVTPPSGLFLSRLHLYVYPTAGQALFEARAQDIGEPSANGQLWSAARGGTLVLRGQARDSRFFRDPSASGTPLTRQDGTYDLSAGSTTGRLNLFYAHTLLSGQTAAQEDWRRYVPGATLTSSAARWRTQVGFADERVSFLRGPQFSGNNARYGLSLSPTLPDGSTLEATASLMSTTLDGVNIQPQRLRFALDGTHDLPGNLTLNGALFYDQLDDVITENAYAESDTGGTLRAEYRGLPRTVLAVGGGLHRVKYINDAHTLRYNPVENNANAQINVRLSKTLKLKGSTDYWWTNGRPIAVDILTGPVGSLFWSSRSDQRLQLAYSPSARTGLTARWRHKAWKNRDFAASNIVVDQDVTAWWLPQDKLTLYATYLDQNFYMREPQSPDVSDASTVVSGVSYQFSPAFSGDIAYTATSVQGSSALGQHVLSLGMSYLTRQGDRWSIHLAQDKLNHAVVKPLNFDVNHVMIEYAKSLF